MKKLIPNSHARSGYWFFLLLLLVLEHSGHPLDSDEGVVLNGAWNLWNGRDPYTDFFEITTPGSFYVVYWFWKLFGPHYLVAKVLAGLFLFSTCIGIFLTSRLLAHNTFTYIGPLLYALASYVWPIVNHNIFNVALIVWATYFFARALRFTSIRNVAFSGLLAGLSALFLQHKSVALVFVCMGVLIYLRIADKRTAWLKFLYVYLLCAAVPTLILLRWPTETLYESLVYFPLFNYTAVNKVDPWPFYLGCWGILVSVAFFRGHYNRLAIFLVLVQAGLLLTTLQRPDYLHVSITLFPLFALIPYMHAHAELTSKTVRLLLYSPLLIFMVGVPLGHLVNNFTNFGLGGKQGAPTLIEYVRARCTETPYLYAGPFMPGLYYETRKLNPTSFGLLLTGFNTPEQFYQAKKDLEIYKPDCVVTNYAITKKFNYDRNNPVDELIRENYRLERIFGNAEVYVRAY